MDAHLMDVFRGQSLYDLGYVARSVGISPRREIVSFTHHRKVALLSSPSIALQRPRQRDSSSCRSGSSLNASTHTERSWKRLRELFHPEARIGVFAGGGARSQVFETEATALEAYRRLGIDLGVFSWP